MARIVLVLLGFVLGYVALFVGIVFGEGLASDIAGFLPEEVISAFVFLVDFAAYALPTLVGGALTGLVMAHYRGGEPSRAAIACGVVSATLLVGALVSRPELLPAGLCVGGVIAGLYWSRRFSSKQLIARFFGERSQEDKERIERLKREISYLAGERTRLSAALDHELVQRIAVELPQELAEHERMLERKRMVLEVDEQTFEEVVDELDCDTFPDRISRWQEHLRLARISLNGAASNRSTAVYLVKKTLECIDKGKESVAVRTACMARGELSDLVLNLESVGPFLEEGDCR